MPSYWTSNWGPKLATLRHTLRTVENWPVALGLRFFPRRPGVRLLRLRNGLNILCRGATRDWEVVRELALACGYGRLLSHLRTLPGQPVVLDLGANIGIFSLVAAAAHEQARVIAYEPAPANVRLCDANRLINPGLAERIQVRPEAVGGQTRTARFFYDEENPQGSTFCYGKNASGGALEVPIRALAEVLDSLPAGPVVAKVDIEGAEYEMLDNTPRPLWEKLSALSVELHDDPRGQLKMQEFLDRFIEWGFQCEQEPAATSVYFLKRPTPPTPG